MQLTVQTIKFLTKGTNDYGGWALYKLTDTDGKIYTTLADGADLIQPGSVIEPKEVMLGQLKDGVQEYKFKKFTMISGGKTPEAVVEETPAPGKPSEAANTGGMTPEAWAEKDRAERWSRESNACFMGIMEFSSKHETPNHISGKFGTVFDAALDWAMAHFQPDNQQVMNEPQHWCEEHSTAFFMKGKMKSYAHPVKDGEEVTVSWCYEHTPKGWQSEPVPDAATAKTTASKDESSSKGLETFYNTCMKQHGLTPEKIAEKYSGLDISTSEKRTTAWNYIVRQETDEKIAAEKKGTTETLPGQSTEDIAGAKELFLEELSPEDELPF